MTDALLASYEQVPYEANPLVDTHPDALATAGILLGMRPAPIDGCRVLELGCSTGGNLIPMADAYPQGQFVGIDFSPRQIAAGQAVVEAVGLKNIELQALDILQFDERFGQFDYIICHGVYSWVPAPVQNKILDICARRLAPQGVAYVSYNTNPGWHARGTVRDLMIYHTRGIEDPKARVEKARACVEAMAQATARIDSAHSQMLKEIGDWLRPKQDSYVFHEFLEDFNLPLYFQEFAQRLTDKRLHYLGEPRLAAATAGFSPELQATIAAWTSDPLEVQQYVDFVKNRTFRRSMLCHAAAVAAVLPGAEHVRRLHMSALVQPASPQPDVRSTASETFRGKEQLALSTNFPPLKAALVALFQAWPASLSFDKLWAEVCSRLGKPAGSATADGQPELLNNLLKCYQSELVALHSQAPCFATKPDDAPRASRLARYQAEGNLPISNLRHRLAHVNSFERQILKLLDGTADRSRILGALEAGVTQGSFEIEPELRHAGDAERRRALGERLTRSLTILAQSALLVEKKLDQPASR